MTATFAPAPSVISEGLDAVTIEFEFELSVNGGLDERADEDVAQRALLASVWSRWWSEVALDLAAPEKDASPGRGRPRRIGREAPPLPREGAISESDGWDLALAHPADLAGAVGGMGFLNGPFSRRREMPGRDFSLGLQSLADTLRRRRHPGPDEGFVFSLTTSPLTFGPQLFCVGIPWARWDEPLPDGVHPFDLVTFEMGLLEYEAWIGSSDSAGRGWVRTTAATLLVSMFAALAAPPIALEGAELKARHEIAARYESVIHGASSCAVNGQIRFDLGQLDAVLAARLQRDDRESVCTLQAALYTLGHHPGSLDGIYGEKTAAAETAFRNKWSLQGVPRKTPEFAAVLMRALAGEQP